MKDITHKPESLRSARATTTIHMPAFCVELLRERKAEKGDALEIAKSSGYLAAKKTWELLPLCHPLPLQNIDIEYELRETSVYIEAEVSLVGATGVEMEALTAASVTALTLYDMLKPHAGTDLSITDTKLLKKTGGKSHFKRNIVGDMQAAILVVSSDVASGKKPNKTGNFLEERLQEAGFSIHKHEAITDDAQGIRDQVSSLAEAGVELIITLGGTGVSPDDCTVDALQPLITKEMPGIMEAARGYGQRRTPYALMSRGVAGLVKQSLLITFPGSKRGAEETLDALLPGLVHALEVIRAFK
ncbi:MAG: bifunctional molybdenum cofactor biosynthesis protein MoaC/MoaB [Nevskiales bacterium]